VTTKVDRIELHYNLTFKTPFHCGTGLRIGLIDRTVIRDSQKYLYVPGSTLKGVLREHCEQLARFYEPDEAMKQLIASPHDEEMALRGLGENLTIVTRLFGSHNHAGRLYFDDAHQSKEWLEEYNSLSTLDDENDLSEENSAKGKYKNLQVDLYTQVRLDRLTRTAVDGALYTSEFGIRELIFKGCIKGWLECTPIDPGFHPCFVMENPSVDSPTYSLLLLLAGINMVERIGGNKSTGKGQCTCDITRLIINKVDCPEQRWKSWLEQLEVLSYYYMV
jgi:CRISPR/Cas system CMR subunit Cmr4 (Cas7 group RAMP superfamily)